MCLVLKNVNPSKIGNHIILKLLTLPFQKYFFKITMTAFVDKTR